MTFKEAIVTRFQAMVQTRELRKRVLFTLGCFLVARIGVHIPVPGINMELFRDFTGGSSLAQFLNLFTGGAVQRASIFSLGITPYINASIVFQILGVLWPRIEEMQKEGGKEADKITQWTRYLTIVTTLFQSAGIALLLQSNNLVREPGTIFVLTTVVLITGGTAFLMWLSERISIKGIGNGTSMLIFLNIVSNLPQVVKGTVDQLRTSGRGPALGYISLTLFVVIIMIMVVIQLGERRIPIQYVGKSSRGVMDQPSVVGRKTYLPVKINTAGVMPIIFASMIMAVPSAVIPLIKDEAKRAYLLNLFGPKGWAYLLLTIVLIVLFSFFYTAIVFDPDKIADSLKQSGGSIPLKRAGKETSEFLEYVATRITFGTAIFLAILGILPNVWFGYVLNIPVMLGGTSLLILVGVAVELIQNIDSHMATQKYKGFNNIRRRR
ncbi:preprotein translocase subunit SecY [Streptobacillus felis]|uniref:Protein translocase subunit SecY n=1 Tax=Streptobacillus felis TaxID=1384509 RepID=A0A7Z0PFE1_9FUSO|nr:preprotein translocase subunit SecY [Streptobacillus felis]NYV28034.1 preprotein translocase subunit SecY [Streptobacillus felis]